ncbi:hypothetical protein ADICYQ_3315 [Cyclobacterium qasimii M12-11B]|uniref:Uncharacterized protein n=1 Tax=Cyclobacterium qasimii M12-11B TaxID=641524 RepID=S7VBT2_9BACT|nr:hypothetical protein ADICYQ_3315 [Cyclobacterium qasimii M12-11B]
MWAKNNFCFSNACLQNGQAFVFKAQIENGKPNRLLHHLSGEKTSK